jgi:HAE1 family hydrophobic/amphiphilic exporter-1
MPATLQIGGRGSSSSYQFTMQSPDLPSLYEYGEIMEEKLGEVASITDVSGDLEIKSPKVNVEIDRARAASLGINMEQIQQALGNAYGTRQVSTIYGANDQYPVLLELLPQFQRDESALNMLYLSSKGGTLIPLGTLARLSPGVGPFVVNHTGQLPSVTLSFNLRPGVALGTAVADVQKLARATLPSNFTTRFSGTAQVFQQSQQGLFFLLIVAVLVIYLVLGMLYESFIHPVTILSALPFAAFGALLALLVFRTDLNIYSYVGIIMLVGLVKKNGIMMVDFALESQRNDGRAPAEAIVQACLIRFRPIMMTTMAALMGTLPIALGFGAGSESRRPLGIAVVGGLAFSQIVTLYVTPVLYTYMDSFQHWLAERSRGRSPETAVHQPEPALGAAD